MTRKVGALLWRGRLRERGVDAVASRGLLRMLLRDASIPPWIAQPPLGRKRVSTLMRRIGIETQYPKPGTSQRRRGPRHPELPYLLGGVDLSRIEANTL